MKENKTKNKIFEVSRGDQYETVEELFKKSEANVVYYTLLILSALIVSCGLLLDNSIIIVGGVLVAPVLTPILVIGLGFSVGETEAIKKASYLVLKSVIIIILIAAFMALLFNTSSKMFPLESSFSAAFLYFIVALASGVAGTFAWVRKEISEILPGVAIAVSLVPPLGIFGISITTFNFNLLRVSFLVFVANLLGVILGSMIIFSLLKFHKTERIVEEKSKTED